MMNCCTLGQARNCRRPQMKAEMTVMAGGQILARVPLSCFVEAVEIAGGLWRVPGLRWSLNSASGTLDLEKFEEGGGLEKMAIQLARFCGEAVREHLFPTN